MKQIILPQLYQNFMMLQRGKPIIIRGQARNIRQIRVSLESEEPLAQMAADVEGESFSVWLPPQQAGFERTLSLYADEETEPVLRFDHINIGDIWMACGQSNMEYFLRYDADWNRVKLYPPNPLIRMYNVPRIAYAGQEKMKDLSDSGYWFAEGDRAWETFSAPGYSFAREIAEHQQIPVGIIGCNWGGTPACAWMNEETLSHEPLKIFEEEYREEVAKYSPEELERLSMEAEAFSNNFRSDLEWRAVMYGITWEEQVRWVKEHANDPVLPMGPWHHYRPSGLYHTMIEKVAPFAVKGFLWYQGETDSGHADIYDRTMEALIACFRRTWENEDLPFLFVQLAPFERWLDCDGGGYVETRIAQEKVSKTVKGAYMASIMDLGDRFDIHPKFKMEVGRRLALLARGHVYGEKILCDPPQFREAVWQGEQLALTFDNAPDGLREGRNPESGFEVYRRGERIPVVSLRTEEDRAILTLDTGGDTDGMLLAYGMTSYCCLQLYNSAGLTPKPFVTIL